MVVELGRTQEMTELKTLASWDKVCKVLGTWQLLSACVTVGITEVTAVMPSLLLEASVRNQVEVGLSSIFFSCLQVLCTYQVYKV